MSDELIHDNNETVVITEDVLSSVYTGRPLAEADLSISIPGCELISELGHGGMGTVFLGRQTKLNRLVAVKSLKVEDTSKEKFRKWLENEAITMADLNHPNIVGCFDIVSTGDRFFLIMEFVPGHTSVHDLVRRYGKLPEYIVIRILQDVARGLDYVHSKGYIHRDLKPDNLLIYNEKKHHSDLKELFEDPNTRVKICDFGIARNDREVENFSNGKHFELMGSPNYIAPEQIFDPGNVNFRADIYAMGSTAIYMLTGKPPFAIPEREKLFVHKEVNDIPNPLELGADISQRLAHIVMKMGACDQDKRYQNYDDLLTDLDHAAGSMPGGQSAANRRAVRITAFWQGMSLIMFTIIVTLAGFWLRSYVQRNYFRERMISLTASMGYWEGAKDAWRVEQLSNHPKVNALTCTRQDSPLTSIQQIEVGQGIDFQIRHPGKGMVYCQVEENGKIKGRLVWDRDKKERNDFSFFSNGRSYPIDALPEHYGGEWLPCRMILHPNGIGLYLGGEPACMVRSRNIKPCKFTVSLVSADYVMLKKIYIYKEEH